MAAHGSQGPPETLHTTTEHPFLTTDRGWVDAQDLHQGERVQRLNGSLGVVMEVQITPGTELRYNLTVKDLHTYTVGVNQWVVHNTSICGVPGFENQVDSWRSADPRSNYNFGGAVVRDVDGKEYSSSNFKGYNNLSGQGPENETHTENSAIGYVRSLIKKGVQPKEITFFTELDPCPLCGPDIQAFADSLPDIDRITVRSQGPFPNPNGLWVTFKTYIPKRP